MSPQDEVQLKVLTMQAAAGDILKAKELFNWIADAAVEAEVQRRVRRYIDSLQVDSAP